MAPKPSEILLHGGRAQATRIQKITMREGPDKRLAEGLAKGPAEGPAKGLAEGLAKGPARGLAK